MKLLSIILATLIISSVSFIGVIVFLSKRNIEKVTFYFVSVASGTMLGTALLHLLPEAMVFAPERAMMGVTAGVLLFFILEKLLVWRHCHSHQDPVDHHRPIAANMVIVGDAIHNFIDGLIIASSFMASTSVGVSVSAAILLHEIPQEMGDFAILLHGGLPFRKALLLNVASATTALAGAVLGYFFLEAAPALQAALVPITAGGFLYIALADLIPQLHQQVAPRQSAWQILLLTAGIAVTYVLKSHTG